MTVGPAASSGWHADPFARHELRFHDGAIWTEHVADRGVPAIDTEPIAGAGQPWSRPPELSIGGGAPPEGARERARVLPELDAAPARLLGARVLVVDEAPRGRSGPAGLDCTVRDHRGRRVGTVRIAREGPGRRALRLVTSDTTREVARVDVLDETGATLLVLRRPARLLKPRVLVSDGAGTPVGELVPRQVLTRLRFDLDAGDRVVGAVEGDGPTDPNVTVTDHTGAAVARVSRTWEVLSATHHPEPDTHLVELLRPLEEPLRSLALAALLGSSALLVQDPVPVDEAR